MIKSIGFNVMLLFVAVNGVFLISACGNNKPSHDLSSFSYTSEMIRRISEGEEVVHHLKQKILLDEKELKGFAQVFGAIRNPIFFHVSKECHVKSEFCLGFDYHVDGEKDVTRMLVGFIHEESNLKISSYSLYLTGTF